MQRAFVLSPLNREIWLNQGEIYKQQRAGTEVGGTFEGKEEDDGTLFHAFSIHCRWQVGEKETEMDQLCLSLYLQGI